MLKSSRLAVDVIDHFKKNNVPIARLFPSMNTYVRVSFGTPPDQMKEFWRVWDLMPAQQNGYELSHKCLPRGRSFSSDKENRQNGALAPEESWYFRSSDL